MWIMGPWWKVLLIKLGIDGVNAYNAHEKAMKEQAEQFVSEEDKLNPDVKFCGIKYNVISPNHCVVNRKRIITRGYIQFCKWFIFIPITILSFITIVFIPIGIWICYGIKAFNNILKIMKSLE